MYPQKPESYWWAETMAVACSASVPECAFTFLALSHEYALWSMWQEFLDVFHEDEPEHAAADRSTFTWANPNCDHARVVEANPWLAPLYQITLREDCNAAVKLSIEFLGENAQDIAAYAPVFARRLRTMDITLLLDPWGLEHACLPVQQFWGIASSIDAHAAHLDRFVRCTLALFMKSIVYLLTSEKSKHLTASAFSFLAPFQHRGLTIAAPSAKIHDNWASPCNRHILDIMLYVYKNDETPKPMRVAAGIIMCTSPGDIKPGSAWDMAQQEAERVLITP